jgi:hypothetical protein
MQEHLGFLKASSLVVKVSAWILLIFGIIGSIGILSGVSVSGGMVPAYPRWMGLVILAVYAFMFFFLQLIAKIADLLIKIINAINK